MPTCRHELNTCLWPGKVNSRVSKTTAPTRRAKHKRLVVTRLLAITTFTQSNNIDYATMTPCHERGCCSAGKTKRVKTATIRPIDAYKNNSSVIMLKSCPTRGHPGTHNLTSARDFYVHTLDWDQRAKKGRPGDQQTRHDDTTSNKTTIRGTESKVVHRTQAIPAAQNLIRQ